ncbi:antagonist of KipI [Caldalkalibacillus uzonensis]|uniref:Antagonist of KipI n=1 Tax=Caldalkalibacillus uzonensis TaxID=353224 RepID=A0ABU0CQ82_9BACI|nr:biotin-dependent carboxyltransferase family protein [Caldalkalibacillus uzonensis]MDQ0338253.1 antagonist of KipI [Caldalkalibacillus uzonensis]
MSLEKNWPLFEVIKPGLFTTVQDLGRTGFQQYGMVVSGAMDPFAIQVANLLVGNRRDEAALEMTLSGPELRLLNDAVLAICGADLSPSLDGRKVPLWKSFLAKAGQTLSFGPPQQGARAYLAASGGIEVPLVMGSKSTYVKGAVGGFHGRPLDKGDILDGRKPPQAKQKLAGRGLMTEDIPVYQERQTIRVILGPEQAVFTEESIETFLAESYQITSQADRMGYRLAGPKLCHRSGADIISDAVALGTVQVPAGGEPIILMADRQTTGGYTRIANVISVDIPVLAQMLPGQNIRFQAISIQEAHQLYRERERFLRCLSVACGVTS